MLRSMTGAIANLHIDNWLLNAIANPCFVAYFWIVKRIVFW